MKFIDPERGRTKAFVFKLIGGLTGSTTPTKVLSETTTFYFVKFMIWNSM